MVEVIHANLEGKIEHFGALRFVRAEWWKEAPRFVLLRYAFGDHVVDRGLRLDLDKRAILDDLEDQRLNKEVHSQAPKIWEIVVALKAQVAPDVNLSRALGARH